MRKFNPTTFSVLVAACAGLVISALAQPDMTGKEVKGFVLPEYGENGELKWRLKGDARFESANEIKLSNMQGESFENGKRRFLFVTSQCMFDREKKHGVTDKKVEITGDYFVITGEGFEWTGDDGKVILRRNVRVAISGLRGSLGGPTDQKSAVMSEDGK